MQKNGKTKKNYIFKPVGEKLVFIGDFESLYKNDNDPWNQSGRTGEMSLYYTNSRRRLVEMLALINPTSLIEVGCGLGYTTNIIQNFFPSTTVIGMDISTTATNKAYAKFPDLEFVSGDIRRSDCSLNKKFDVVILNQLLWYVLEDLSDTIDNCFSLLTEKGKIVISQAFLKAPQRYGEEICDGFDGLMKYLKNKDLNIEYSSLYASDLLIHDDGLVIINKREKKKNFTTNLITTEVKRHDN